MSNAHRLVFMHTVSQHLASIVTTLQQLHETVLEDKHLFKLSVSKASINDWRTMKSKENLCQTEQVCTMIGDLFCGLGVKRQLTHVIERSSPTVV